MTPEQLAHFRSRLAAAQRTPGRVSPRSGAGMTLDQLGSLRTAIARGRSVAGPEPVYFASGMSSVGRLRASLEIGQPVGITISNCPARCWEWVMANLADPRLRIFVDSGAYAEYTSEQEVSPAEWHRRYEKMARLAETVKSPRASIVLPDRVRDPAASLQRLADLAPYVRRIIGSGAEALLPLQKGRYTDPLVYLRDAARVIGVPVRTLVPSVPVVSRAYTTSQILDLVRRLQPARLHLLGITRSEAAKDLLPQIQALAPEALLSYDSVLAREGAGIISSVGGRWGGGPRGQTRARYQALSDIDPAAVVRTQEGGAPRRASHGVGRGKGGLDVLIRVLAQGKRGNPLDAAAARLTDLVGEEFELNRRARTAVKNQASLWLSGLYPDEWYEPGGIPPQQAMKVAGGGVLNWDYFVDKAQELLVREGISSTGRRSGTLAEAATQPRMERHVQGRSLPANGRRHRGDTGHPDPSRPWRRTLDF